MGRVKALLMDMIENQEEYDHDFDCWVYNNESKEDFLEEVKSNESKKEE